MAVKRPLPKVLAMILAEVVHRDTATAKHTIVGTYATITTTEFPCTRPSISLYIALTDGHGPTPMKIRIIDADEARTPVFESDKSIVFPSPLTVVEIVFCQRKIVFPEPGQYRIQLFVDDDLLAERRLIVHRKADGPG